MWTHPSTRATRPFYARFEPRLTRYIPEIDCAFTVGGSPFISLRPESPPLPGARRFRHQRHDRVALEREIFLQCVVDVLLRQRVGPLEPQRDAARVSPQQVDGLQRVQPVAVLEQRVLQAISLL